MDDTTVKLLQKGKGKNKDAKGKQAAKKNAEGQEEEHKGETAQGQRGERGQDARGQDTELELHASAGHSRYYPGSSARAAAQHVED